MREKSCFILFWVSMSTGWQLKLVHCLQTLFLNNLGFYSEPVLPPGEAGAHLFLGYNSELKLWPSLRQTYGALWAVGGSTDPDLELVNFMLTISPTKYRNNLGFYSEPVLPPRDPGAMLLLGYYLESCHCCCEAKANTIPKQGFLLEVPGKRFSQNSNILEPWDVAFAMSMF